MKLKRTARLGFSKNRKGGKSSTGNFARKKSVTFAHGSKVPFHRAEGRQQVTGFRSGCDERDDNAKIERCADLVPDRQDEAISFISDESSCYGRQGEEILFEESSNAKKKKKASLFSAMKHKFTKRKITKTNEETLPTVSFELCPEEAAPDQSSDLLFSNYNWEKFMDTVAFPEKHLEEPYRQFMDFVTAQTKTASSEPLISETIRNPYEHFKEKKKAPLSHGTENFSTSAPLANFLIEKIPSHAELLDRSCADNIESVTRKRGQKAKPAKSKKPIVVHMYKHEEGDRLGLGVETIYGKDGIYISQLIEESISASTKLEAGMKILSINDQPCPSTVVGTINSLCAIKGVVRITAEPAEPVSVLTSGMRNVSYLLGYTTDFPNHGGERRDEKSVRSVRSVRSYADEDDSTVAGETTLASVTEDSDDATFAETMQTASNDWGRGVHDHVEVARSRTSRNYELVFRIDKERGEPVGISLIDNKDWPGLYINTVYRKGKFAATQLKPGMKLVEINGHCCANNLDEAVRMICDCNGALELTVEDEGLYCHDKDYSNIREDAIPETQQNHGGVLVKNFRFGKY